MKKPQIKILVLFSAILVVSLFTGCQNNNPPNTPLPSSQEAPGPISIVPSTPNDDNLAGDNDPRLGIKPTSGTIQEETDTLIVDAVYPITGNEVVDPVLKDFAQKQVDQFKKSAPEVPADASYKQNSIYLTFTNTKLFEKDHYQSFQFDITTYTGGAHGNTVSETMTFNMDSATPIMLADIFKPNSNYLKKLSEIARSSLNQEMPDADQQMLNSGTTPTPENYSRWTFDNNNLVIHFDPYQVAPYAAGLQSVSIDLSTLSDLLEPEFLNS